MNKQNVVVTGAGGTLCSEIAVDFAKQGHNVVLVGRSLDKLQKVEEEIKAFGGSCVCITADVKDEARMLEVREEVHKIFGPVTILINGAGGNQPDAVTTINEYDPKELTEDRDGMRGFFNLDMKKFLDVIEINTLGTVIPSRVFALDMIEQAGTLISEATHPDANIIFGATSSEEFQDEMRVTVIATGFDQANFAAKAAPAAEVKKSEDDEVAMKPVEAPADISEIDEIFKIFNR